MSNKRGQTVVEYGVLLAVLAAALVAMQIYVKRGAMGRLRGSGDQIGDQYAPKHTTSKFTTKTESDTVTKSFLKPDQDLGGGKTGDVIVNETIINKEVTTRTGSETVGALTKDLGE